METEKVELNEKGELINEEKRRVIGKIFQKRTNENNTPVEAVMQKQELSKEQPNQANQTNQALTYQEIYNSLNTDILFQMLQLKYKELLTENISLTEALKNMVLQTKK